MYYTSLIDENKKESSDYLQIINSNDMIPSTVKSDTAGIGAGKSNPDTVKATSTDASKAAAAADVPAPEAVEPVAAADETAPEPAADEVVADAPAPAADDAAAAAREDV